MDEKLLPCPFCGDENIEIEDSYSSLNITCCCTLSIQKCDILNWEQRETLNTKTYRYSDDVELFAKNVLIQRWNLRRKLI